MNREDFQHFRPLVKEPQLIPPSLLLFLIAFLNAFEFIFGFSVPETRKGALMTVAVVGLAAILLERAMDRGFRYLESRSRYGKREGVEKALKSTLFLSLAALFYDRQGLETLISASVVFIGIALFLHHFRSFNDNAVILIILDALIVAFVSFSLFYMIFGVEAIL